MFKIPDLSQPSALVITFIILFVAIIGRYVLISGAFYVVFHLWFPAKWLKRQVVNRQVNRGQLRKEIAWSTITAMIFAAVGLLTIWAWQKGYTKVYTDIADFGWWYLPVSLILSLIIHETYYYWLHRLMHHRRVFRYVHKVHHESNITSPFTAFSFHPLEGLLQAIIFPLTLLVLPLSIYVIIVQLVIMTLSSVINHLNIELYPHNFHKHRIGKWIIGATHHSLHHKQFRYNFGLYFTFWDKLKSTESPEYDNLFEVKTKK